MGCIRTLVRRGTTGNGAGEIYPMGVSPALRLSKRHQRTSLTTGSSTGLSTLQFTDRIKIHGGKLDEFKATAAECLAIVKEKCTGTLQGL